jgi:hypothetical protein
MRNSHCPYVNGFKSIESDLELYPVIDDGEDFSFLHESTQN